MLMSVLTLCPEVLVTSGLFPSTSHHSSNHTALHIEGNVDLGSVSHQQKQNNEPKAKTEGPQDRIDYLGVLLKFGQLTKPRRKPSTTAFIEKGPGAPEIRQLCLVFVFPKEVSCVASI